MIWKYILIILMGYLFGSLNLAYFVARAKGIDIRSHGSNNAGASNAAITMGMWAGVAVAVHDAAKALIPSLLAGAIFPELPSAAAAAGAAAVLGHIFPFYMRFRGGKGFAPFMGLTLALDWRFFLGILAVAVLLTVITDYIVTATFTSILSLPAYLGAVRKELAAALIVSAASLVILVKHIENIRRIIKKEEITLRHTLSGKGKIQ